MAVEPDTQQADHQAYFLTVAVENVRCFRKEQAVDFSDGEGRPARWTILLGNNGVGKTTLLQALATLRPDPEALRVDHGLEPFVRPVWGFDWRPYAHVHEIETLSARIRASLRFAPRIDARIGTRSNAEIVYLQEDAGAPEFAQASPEQLPNEGFYTSHVFAYGAYRRLPSNSLANEPSGPVASLFDSDARLINAEDWFLQRDYAANNPRLSDEMRRQAATSRDLVASVLKAILLDVEALEPFVVDARSGTTELRAKTPDGMVRVSHLGLGYQSTLAWVVDLAARMVAAYPESPNPLAEPAVVLVDEIDIHLHPSWQRVLLQELSQRFPNVQFIATAHSPLIVQGAEDVNVAVLRREGDHVVIDKAPESVRHWRVDQILTSDLFGLPTARPPALDAKFKRREALLKKETLSAKDRAELERLREEIAAQPGGESPSLLEAEEILLELTRERASDARVKKKPRAAVRSKPR